MNYLTWTILLAFATGYISPQTPKQDISSTSSELTMGVKYVIVKEYPAQVVKGKIIYLSNQPQQIYEYELREESVSALAATYSPAESQNIQEITFDDEGNWIIRVIHLTNKKCIIQERQIK